ncbi:MAG: uracil-DNA glycosylase [Candidatus Acidiferrales bacterium]
MKSLRVLEQTITACRKCPRLVRYREEVARVKRRAFRDQVYWGRPVPGFGDSHAKLFILGLAPAAHGANRTGRVFTGDRSGDFLYRELWRIGFANQPESRHRDDGLHLANTFISATIRCAPPQNKPLPEEICNCTPYLEAELDLLRPRAVLALGHIAFDAYLRVLKLRGALDRKSKFTFSHGACIRLPHPLPRLYASYHPSQQNTQTGRLTPAMMARVLRQIRNFLNRDET